MRWKIDRAADTPKGRKFNWNRPFCVLIATIFLDCSSSGICWYALAKSSFEKVFPPASDTKRSSNFGRDNCQPWNLDLLRACNPHISLLYHLSLAQVPLGCPL